MMNRCGLKGELGIGMICEFWQPGEEQCRKTDFCEEQIEVEETRKRIVTVYIALPPSNTLNAYVGKDMEILSASVTNRELDELVLIGKDNFDGDVEEITIQSCIDGDVVPSNWHYLTSYTPPNYQMRHLFLDVPGV